MSLRAFKHDDWGQIWAGGWSVQTCSHLGNHLTKGITFDGQSFLSQSVIFVCENKSACWARQADRERVGAYLSGRAATEKSFVRDVCEELKIAADEMLAFIKKHEGTPLTLSRYQDYWNRVCHYYQRHVPIKYIVDYLPAPLLEKFLPELEEARLYAEPVFKRVEDFVEAYSKRIAEKEKLSVELPLCMIAEETKQYLSGGKLPAKRVLEERFKHTALLFDSRSYSVRSGKRVGEVEKVVMAVPSSGEVRGEIAHKGKAKGVARIIFDPHKVKTFNTGDILVTGMTRPEFLPLMKKASAFVTDAGGILSHAAIVARELKKPCIIGTKIATKVLKDGDRVEVDAERGTVTVLKKAGSPSEGKRKARRR